MPESDVSIGELSRRMTAMEGRFLAQFEHLNQRLDTLQYVSREVYAVQMQQQDARITALEERNRWLIRTSVVGFILPTLVGIMVALLAVQ